MRYTLNVKLICAGHASDRVGGKGLNPAVRVYI
jgi:hypothetical protein